MQIVERGAEKRFAKAATPPPWPDAKRIDPSQIALAGALGKREKKARQLGPVPCKQPK